MDTLDLVSLSKRIPIKNRNKKAKNFTKCIIISLTFLFILNLFTIIVLFIFYKKVISMNNQKGKIETDNISNINNNINKVNISLDNNYLIEEYIKRQNDFCNYPDKFYNQEFENLINLTDFSFRNVSYQMYVYKHSDNFMSNEILKTGTYEPIHMSHFLDILKYYGEKKNIMKNEDIFMLDIGGNLGAYPSFLGRFGYSIITFEASPRNSYIIYKNYCHINRNSNIIIVNKGLSNEEKTCNYYSQIGGIGNGVVLCDKNYERIHLDDLTFKKTFDVSITKLSNFMPYLSNKNIGLIKLDIEGSEAKVVEDAIELISKYHIPFVFSEFNPQYLEKQGTNPKKYLELFTSNGYKISYEGFLNVSYVTPEEIKSNTNLYFIYQGN